MPRQKGAVEDWASFFRQAEFDLGGYSASHLQEALAEYRRTETFYPTIAAIVKICDRIRSYDEFRLKRALISLNGEEKPPVKSSDDNDRYDGPRDFASLRSALMAGKGPLGGDTPPINTARTDTPESLHDLSATLERRNAVN